MEYLYIEEIETGCPECGKDLFKKPLPYTFEAISGYREENEYRKATLSFDEEINLKMESEVKAPQAGTVQSILVKEGDNVQTGDQLVIIG